MTFMRDDISSIKSGNISLRQSREHLRLFVAKWTTYSSLFRFDDPLQRVANRSLAPDKSRETYDGLRRQKITRTFGSKRWADRDKR